MQLHPHAHKALEYATMNQATMTETTMPLPTHKDVLTDLLRLGAQRLLAQAIQAEVDDYLAVHQDVRDEAGRQQVVRNGSLPQRILNTGVGPVEVKQPRVRDRRPAGQQIGRAH